MSSSLGRRRRRILGEDERRLWDQVAASVTPLERPGRAAAEDEAAPPGPVVVAPEPPPAAEVAPPPPKPARRARSAPEAQPPAPPPSKRALAGWIRAIHMKHRGDTSGESAIVPQPPSLAPLDDRTKRRLVRGTMAIDERLDLHGMTQEAAHGALRHFLVRARDRGARVVLVITGKGKPGGSAHAAHERGVLRRSVPHWLGDPTLRDVVVGFEEAHLAHGGAGAIYVRLRRRRDIGEGGR